MARRRNDDLRPDARETFVHVLVDGEPNASQLYRRPDWGWLDSLCGDGYHCVSYRLVNAK